MAGPIIVRAARLNDSAEIARLCVELGYPVTPREIKSRLSSLLEVEDQWIAVAPGPRSTLQGWVAAAHRLLLESGTRVEITGLVVDPTARRKGIGKALVSGVENWAASKGISSIFVRSNVARGESHGFYEQIGYRRTKTQHAYTKVK